MICTTNYKFIIARCRTFSQISAQRPHKYVSSKVARQQFLDYFIKDQGHEFVRSSPVVPFYDPTVPFVNAGMNQFKNVFLGTYKPKYKKVANSQKCIRVGGKHNDLDVVGTDGYHHTFFEMLGNWSFGECSKKDSCYLAWNLLTKVYHINKNLLYVTYFAGDESLGLPPDEECRDVWRNLGLPEARILPFGMKDNFWEMGLQGPCGPCTEIHYDHRGGENRAAFVNKGLHELIELWNIVFIEYNRDEKGSIFLLPKKHVDTGMGFERLVAVLQGKISNYDTDLFRTLFTAIAKICNDAPQYKNYFGENDWNCLHTGYRILADHSRMITACLADGMIPEENNKLRKVMRRAFGVGSNTFKKDIGLLKELSNYVIESLGHVYPEMENNAKQIHQIIDYEEDVYQTLRQTASADWEKIAVDNPTLQSLDILEMPGLVQAFKEIKDAKEVSSKFGLRLYDTYGLDESTINKLSTALNLSFDLQGFKEELTHLKTSSKTSTSLYNETILNFPDLKLNTDDSLKYDYIKHGDNYIFNELNVRVLKIYHNGEFVKSIPPRTECSLILDKTNMYYESGGQVSDVGLIKFDFGHFHVNTLRKMSDYIFHVGVFDSEHDLKANSKGLIKFDEHYRLNNMRNHTVAHLLNAFIKDIKGATCQKSSKVTNQYVNLDVGIFSEKLTMKDIERIELEVGNIIKDGVSVKSYNIDGQSLLNMDRVTMIPGEIYPESGIRLVEIAGKDNILSREPCCGTHVLNTSDIQDFCVVHYKSLGRSTASLYGVTGERASLAKENAKKIVEEISKLDKSIKSTTNKPEGSELILAKLKQKLNYEVDDDNILPVTVKNECLDKLETISKRLKDTNKNSVKEFIDLEMQKVLLNGPLKSKSNREFVIHCLQSPSISESVPLQKATKFCENIPVLILSYTDNTVKARCCVPKELKNEKFNAKKWLEEISSVFKSPVMPPKGQDASLVCNMKGRKINASEWDKLLEDSLERGKTFAATHL